MTFVDSQLYKDPDKKWFILFFPGSVSSEYKPKMCYSINLVPASFIFPNVKMYTILQGHDAASDAVLTKRSNSTSQKSHERIMKIT